MAQVAVTVKQITDRLQNATSSERLIALQELQGLARSEPAIVGEFALQRVLDFLKEQGSTEEYQESLDLIDRLVKCRDRIAASANTSIILSSVSNIDLLLDLLEHQDLTVGVMTSQILTEVHANEPRTLELQIQECPAGMNKLLQRLPDSSREEVRNQAIVLVQQLTAQNEEMKKTVVFNEGFEIIFGIIRSEGGSSDAGHVIQDCLRICSNILHGSETCQRLFFGMGSDWILRLSEFFNPGYLESINNNSSSSSTSSQSRGARDDDYIGDENTTWFEQPNRVLCAALGLKALAGSLKNVNPKHQRVIGETIAGIVPSVAFWILRKGPAALTDYSLLLLERIVDSNGVIAHHFSNTVVKASPANPGITIPTGIDLPTVSFGWRPHPSDDRRFIVLTSLLAERYIYSGTAWRARILPVLVVGGSVSEDGGESGGLAATADDDIVDTGLPDGLSQGCLRVLEKILAADTSVCDMAIQHILAPPPPLLDEEDDGAGGLPPAAGGRGGLESMRPLGSILLNTLVECTSRVLGGNSSAVGGHHLTSQSVSAISARAADVEVAERAANLLGLVFIYSGQLARELSTVISTMHTSLAFIIGGVGGVGGGAAGAPQQILPYLLSTAGRAARIPGSGHQILVALLRLLAIVAHNCDIAARQMLDDPSNFFVLELATPASEAAGVPPVVQVTACLFLGTCFKALVDPTPTTAAGDQASARESNSDSSNRLSQRSLLGMIDSRIGLTRFTDLVKRPLLSKGGGGIPSDFFFSKGFRVFYEQTLEAVRSGIFDFYTAGGAGADDGPHKQVIEMQKEKISELETRIHLLEASAGAGVAGGISGGVDKGGKGTSAGRDSDTVGSPRTPPTLLVDEIDLQVAEEKIAALEAALKEREKTLDGMAASETAIIDEVESLRKRAEYAERELRALQQQQEERALAAATAAADGLSDTVFPRELIEQYKDQIMSLKQTVVELSDERQALREEIEQRDRKIDLLEENLRGPVPYETNREKKIAELEARNAELKQQLWSAEDELSKAKDRGTSEESLLAASSAAAEAIDIIELSVGDLVRSLGLGHTIVIPPELSGDTDAETVVSLDDKVRALDSVLRQCADKISLAAGTCSDIAEGAGLTISDLRGDEGTLERLLSCAEGIAAMLHDTQDKVLESDNYLQQVEDAQLELEAAERLRISHENAIARLDTDIGKYAEDVKALQTTIADLTESLATKAKDCEDLRTELNSIDRSSEAYQRASQQIISLELLVAELKKAVFEKEEGFKQVADELIELKEVSATAAEESSSRAQAAEEKEWQLLDEIAAVTAELKQTTEQVEMLRTSIFQREGTIEELEEKLNNVTATAADAAATAAIAGDGSGSESSHDLLELIAELKTQLETKNAEIDSLEQELAAQPAVVISPSSLSSSAEQSQSANNHHHTDEEVLLLQNQVSSLSSQVDNKADEVVNLEGKLQAAEEASRTIQSALEEKTAECEELSSELTRSKADVEALKVSIAEERANFDNIVQSLGKNTETMEKDMETQNLLANASVSTSITGLNERIHEIKEEYESRLKDAHSQLQGKEDELSEALEKIDSLERSRGTMTKSLQELGTAAETQQVELDAVTAQLRESEERRAEEKRLLLGGAEDSSQRISELELSNTALQEELKTSLAKLASLQISSDKTIEDLQLRINDLDEELSRERAEIAAERLFVQEKEERDRILLESEPSRFAQAQLEMVRQQLSALQTERVADQQVYGREIKVAKEALLAAEDRTSKAIEDLNNLSKTSNSKIEELQKSVSCLNTTIEALQTEKLALERTARDAEKAKADLHAEIESLHRAREIDEAAAVATAVAAAVKNSDATMVPASAVKRPSREGYTDAEYQEAVDRWNQEKVKLREIITALNAEVQQLKSQHTASTATTAAAGAASSSAASIAGSPSPSTIPKTPGPFDSPAPRPPPSGGSAYQQQLEIRRLHAEAERLARELNAANGELHAVLTASARKDGEMAGMVFTFETLREEVTSLREENAALTRRLYNERKQVKELMGERDTLQSSLRYEQEELQGMKDRLVNDKFKSITVNGHTLSSVDFEITQSTLVEVVKWLQLKIEKTRTLADAASSGTNTSTDLTPAIFESPDRSRVRGGDDHGTTSNGGLGGGSAGEDSGRKKLLSYRAADHQNQTKYSLSSSSDSSAVAFFSGYPVEESKEGLQQLSLRELASRTKSAAETLVNAREREIAQQKIILGGKERELEEAKGRLRALAAAATTGGEQSRKDAIQSGQLPPMTPSAQKSISNVLSPLVAGSPAARDVARLKTEVNRERRKLLELQEEHSDLLCLLAQQEVELGVFRSTLFHHCGATVVAVAEQECERASIEKYGSYTNFRSADGTIGASP